MITRKFRIKVISTNSELYLSSRTIGENSQYTSNPSLAQEFDYFDARNISLYLNRELGEYSVATMQKNSKNG